VKLGLASSSATEIIEAVLDKLELARFFAVVQSAEHEPYGKPHPAVYIECARRLGVPPDRCLAIEDSPAGVLAAKAARMTCIAIPAPELRDDHRYCIADARLESLVELMVEG
jgi:sugar-phosphatase